MEAGADKGLTFATFAKGLEALGSRGLSLRVEFKNEVSDFLVTSGNGEVDTLVSRAAVVVKGREAASAAVEELSSVHFFFPINLIIN